jgi:hypothetical protein
VFTHSALLMHDFPATSAHAIHFTLVAVCAMLRA